MMTGETLCYIINYKGNYISKADLIVLEDGVEAIVERLGEAIPLEEAVL